MSRTLMTRLYLPALLLLLMFTSILDATAQQRPELIIEGVTGEAATNVRLYLEAEANAASWGSPQHVRERAAHALQPFGYYRPTVHLAATERQLTLAIEPGPRMQWTAPRLSIEGPAAELTPFQRLLRDHPFDAGAPLSHADYDTYRERWLTLSKYYGFLDARLAEHRLLIDRHANQATAVLSLISGPRYHIGAIHYRGGSVDSEVLDKLSEIKPGTPYRQADLRALHRSLQETGYFGSVQVRTERTDEQTVDVIITLTEAPLDRYAFGLGFGTDTGPRGRIRWERPLVNRQGHRLESELAVSRPRVVLGTQYLIPLSHPLDHFSRISSSLEYKDNKDTQTRLLDIGYDIHRRLPQGWQLSYGAHLLNERYRQGSEPKQELTFLLPGIHLSQLQLAYGLDPRHGHKSWLELVGSDRRLGADSAFLRARIGHAQLWALGQRHRVIARAELGAIATSDIRDIPASLRFFTGGDRTVRGFDYEALAPRNTKGELVGGRYLNVASIEYSYRFAERWRGALFTDAGRAFNRTDEPWHQSVGVGIRWLSPVGQVRVDLAVPIDDDRESGWRIHIFLGPPL